jgi:hypothetical protein
MKNSNSKLTSKPAGNPVPEAWALGWNHAQDFLPFSPDYENWPKLYQDNYELGRLQATALRTEGLGKKLSKRNNRYHSPKIPETAMQVLKNSCPVDHAPASPSLRFGTSLDRRGFPKPIPQTSPAGSASSPQSIGL